ncbi:hypothetical protein J4216_01485 [Candidatus Woesearchaeota archaeon]|nr:hypothetical protein [Candidatus Woesearchaeota archaeon]
MSTITINIDDDVENRFRGYINKEYGNSKGALGKAITEAIDIWLKEKEQEEITKKAIEFLNKKRKVGGKLWKNREELHER